MRFFDCKTAPSPRRVRIFLAEKGVTVDTVQVDLAAGQHLSPDFAKINPQLTVPVLELDDGTRLRDSNSICIYLDSVFPEPNLTGRDAKDRAVIAGWQRTTECNGLDVVAECFRNTAKGFRDRALTGVVDYPQIAELAERGRYRVRQFFADLDGRLGQSEFVAGERFTVADITALVAVDFSRAIKEMVAPEQTNLKRWHASVSSRPSAAA